MKKNIFNKKKIFFTKLNFFLIILLFIIIFFQIFFLKKEKYFEIADFSNLYYLIPDDRGGKKIENIDKKSLHLNQTFNNDKDIQHDFEINYSIQLYTSPHYNNVTNYLENLLKKHKLYFNKNELYILIFESNLGLEYFLLYKNFEDFDKANKFCLEKLHIIDKCLIVNAKNF